MGAQPGGVPRQTGAPSLVRQVRSALAHLHDPVYLQRHPLAAAAGGGRALRERLLWAVAALGSCEDPRADRAARAGRPSPGPAPGKPILGRAHDLLTLRYAEGLDSRSVAARLAVSQGQYYRDHQAALDAVASLLATELGEAAPLVGTHRSVGNLPAALTSFVGREREVGRVRELVAAARLVTLTGAGGIGKTRLAVEAARGLDASFADGIWFVDLGPVGDPSLIPGAILAALDQGEGEDREPAARLRRVLRDRELLLILDNCEHLVDACAALAAGVLGACPLVRVLATSREVLGVAGETTLRVPALSLPASPEAETAWPLPSAGGGAGDGSVLDAHEATRLFVERSRQASPTGAPVEADAAAVVRLCRRLDGMPLAIELAAARTRALSVREIADRLDDAFRLLGGGRGVLPRHQTLRAAVDWSYELLPAPERTLFTRLSVFAGGWTLSAAEAVCGRPEPAGGAHLIQPLASLVDKSLVLADATSTAGEEGGTRYRLLEPLRQYAAEKLVASGEAPALRDRHAAYYASLVRGQEPRAADAAWHAEQDNLRAALDWVTERGRADEAVALARLLTGPWMRRGPAREGQLRLERALALPGWRDTAGRTDALLAGTALAWVRGDVAAQQRMAEEALALARAAGSRWDEARALARLSIAAGYRAEYATARTLEARARALAAEARGPDAWPPSHQLANVARDEGKFAEARRIYEETLAYHRERGDRFEQGHVLSNMGWLALFEGDLARSRADQEESLSIWRALDARREIAVSLTALGLVALASGEPEEAERRLREGLRGHLEIGNLWGTALSLEGFAGLAAPASPAVALRLAGAAAALRARIRRPVPLAARPLLDGWLRSARGQVGTSEQERFWKEGYDLSEDDAAALVASYFSERVSERVPAQPG